MTSALSSGSRTAASRPAPAVRPAARGEAELLDELELMLYPVVAGKGARLFTESGLLRRLELVGSQRTGSGIVINTYRPA